MKKSTIVFILLCIMFSIGLTVVLFKATKKTTSIVEKPTPVNDNDKSLFSLVKNNDEFDMQCNEFNVNNLDLENVNHVASTILEVFAINKLFKKLFENKISQIKNFLSSQSDKHALVQMNQLRKIVNDDMLIVGILLTRRGIDKLVQQEL